FMDSLTDRPREAALTTEGPLIVIAGAGSGKTKMLTSRIAYLIQGLHVPAHHVLAMTFTNKAAGEMRERVEKMLNIAAQAPPSWGGSYLGVPEIGTFHSVCVRLLRREMARTPFTKPFVIYDDSDQLSLVKSAMDKLGIDDKSFNPKGIQGAINRAKCDATEPHEMQAAPHDIFARQVKRVYEQYQKDLFSNNALDFSEILCLTYRLLRDNEDLRAKYQKRFRYIHVDEYQDTNRAQYLLLSMLAQKANGGHQNICVVGDEDQSIYKWRGADIRNILDFELDYPGAHIVKLEQNYRSTQTIIKAAGHVIRNNRTRKDKTLWTDNEEGTKIIRAQLPDERAEAEMVVAEIKRMGEHEDRAFGDFSIFYRTNAQSRQFEDVLRREKIPYQIVGGLRFYDRKEIKDVLSYFKVILNPADSVGLKRIINVPARGIGKTTVDKLDAYQAESGKSWWDVLNEASRSSALTSAGTAKKLLTFTTLMERLMAEQPKLLLSALYHLILDETGYVRELRQEGTEESMARIENLEEFDTLLQEFEEDFFERIPEAERAARNVELLPLFIEQSALASEADSQDAGASVIKLMTLHSSKGLEFPVVFMVGMEEGLFPSVKAWEETPEEDIEEERRLCYVGMTRAREQLYMMNAVVRRIWGNISYQEPSRFFLEVPEEFVELKDFSYGQKATQYRTGSSRQFGYGRSSDETEYAPVRSIGTMGGSGVKNDVVGRRMTHPEYGPGTVIASEGSGEDQKVTIEFKGRSQRKFLFRYVASYLDQ
ncbi:MAG: ATP-dependent helicase, partial [Bdellovibrionota bacterium]